jgi:hypothetical protein
MQHSKKHPLKTAKTDTNFYLNVNCEQKSPDKSKKYDE